MYHFKDGWVLPFLVGSIDDSVSENKFLISTLKCKKITFPAIFLTELGFYKFCKRQFSVEKTWCLLCKWIISSAAQSIFKMRLAGARVARHPGAVRWYTFSHPNPPPTYSLRCDSRLGRHFLSKNTKLFRAHLHLIGVATIDSAWRAALVVLPFYFSLSLHSGLKLSYLKGAKAWVPLFLAVPWQLNRWPCLTD